LVPDREVETKEIKTEREKFMRETKEERAKAMGVMGTENGKTGQRRDGDGFSFSG